MSNWKKTGQPCPGNKIEGLCSRPSSDAYAINNDGVGYCFSCRRSFGNNNEERTDFKGKYVALRGIKEKSLRYYNAISKVIDETPVEIGFIYPDAVTKVRSLHKKGFFTRKPETLIDTEISGLFGADKFPAGSRDTLTITEGELDCISVYQMLNGNTAAVSVRSSSSAFADVKKAWKYVNSFDKIILCLDNDARGREAAEKIAGLFEFSKVYKVTFSLFKDANEYLMKDKVSEFMREWVSANRYTPDSIISSFPEIMDALKEENNVRICDYPIEKLNDMLKGPHKGEVIVVKGLEGIGKTELFRLFEDHILQKFKDIPIGVIHLEEALDTTIQGMVSYFLKKKIDTSDGDITNEEVFESFKKLVDNDESKVSFYSSFDVDDENVFMDNIRFMVTTLGVKIVFFDHISWVASSSDASDDERRKLDRLSQNLKKMAEHLGFALFMISHVNDDGKTRGSRNITKDANTVIHLSRDPKNSVEEERNKMYISVEKSRRRGTKTGPAGYVVFDHETTTLKEDKLQVGHA